MKRSGLRQALIVATFGTCVVYLLYRACFTLNFTTPYAVFASLALYAAELFMGVLLGLFLLQVWHVEEPPEQPVLPDRTVDVLVPTYNEDIAILRTTLRACVQMDYPHKTILCDDGGTEARISNPETGPAARKRQEALQALCADVGAVYMTRPKNEHAKAGNMNSAMKQTDGEFVIILDADHVPERNFITRLIGYFRDEKLAFVQTPHAFYNFDSFQAQYDPVRSKYWEEGHLFYDVIQPGRNYWDVAIFAGSAAMFRRQALAEIGGFAVETITEDLHTGLRLHAHGWKSLAISERLIAGQAAPDVTTFHTQRLRWGEGNLSIFAYDNPLTTRGLTLTQRLCYLGSMIHWANGPFLMLVYLTPLLMLFSDVPPVAQFEWLFATLIVLYMALNIITFRVVSNGHGSFWSSQIYSMTNMWTSTRGVLRAMFLRRFQKFIVTSKRGRQSKSVLPFIWPHVTFFLASVLALVWGWYRPISGVSDDYYKPMLASGWAVFHICVVLFILRRAFWPEDRRFSYRHVVSLPASVACAEGTTEGYAVTVDLNDTGVGLLAYAPLKVGSRRVVTIRGGAQALTCLAEVRRCEEIDARLRAGAHGVRAYRCGLSFIEPSAAQVDGLNELCWHYAVPLSYRVFDRNRVQGSGPPPLRLPLLLFQEGATEATCYAVTDDLSRDGLTALIDADLPVGTEMCFRMPTPGAEVCGTVRITEAQPMTLAARAYRQYRFVFTDVDEAGRTTLDVLLASGNARRLRPMLRPYKEPRRVPVQRPASIGVALLAVLIPVALGLFHLNYRDELFLDRLAEAPLPLAAEQETRLLALHGETVETAYPSNDRLVLLESALLHADKRTEAAQITRVLARRDMSNLSLQLAYAQALDDMQEPGMALGEYKKLLKRVKAANWSAQEYDTVLLASARAAVHAKQFEQAIPWYRDILASKTENEVALRNELAGVLLSADLPADAIALFGSAPQDWDGALLFTKARLKAHEYVDAEKDARRLLERRPGDVTASLLLLDALARQEKIGAARDLADALIEEHPAPPMVRIRVGEIALAIERYPAALLLFQGLLEDGTNDAAAQRGFIDAAAGVPTLEKINPAVVGQIARAAESGALAKDAAYLGRLAWVCQRLKQYDHAVKLARLMVDLEPQSPEARQRYVGVLLLAGRADEAVRYLQQMELTLEVRTLLIDVYFHEKNYDAVEKIAKANLHFNPLSLSARISLIEVALAKKDHARAQELFADLQKFPQESPPELRSRLANLHLWAGDARTALIEYRRMAEQAPTRKDWWRGYVDAAASAPELTPADAKMIKPIAEQSAKDGDDVVFLARLAWVTHRLKEPKLCDKVLDRALALKPAEPALRKELAGALGAAGRYKEALALYQGLPLDSEERRRLASLSEAANDFVGAAAQYRLILKKQPNDATMLERLGDVLTWQKDFAGAAVAYEQLVKAAPTKAPDVRRRLASAYEAAENFAGAAAQYRLILAKDPKDKVALERLGLVLSWQKEFAQAAEVYEQLVAAEPNNLAWLVRVAELRLWSGNAPVALAAYTKLLDKDLQQPKLWRGFVDAAGQVPRLDKAQAKLARAVGRAVHSEKDALFLSRLAWVLVKAGATADAEAVLKQADALYPSDPPTRKELAGVFGAVGNFKRAIALFEGIELTDADRVRLVQFYNGAQDFAAAEIECRKLLKSRPKDRAVELLLADTLAYGGKNTEAAALLQRLRLADPDSKELAHKLALVDLWGRNYPAAVEQFARLLEGDMNQPKLWADFVAAAAAVPELDNRYRKLLVGLADKTLADPPTDTQFLSRLAQALRTLQEPDKAAALLQHAVEIDPSSRLLRLQLAQTLYDAGRFGEAKVHFRQLLPEEPIPQTMEPQMNTDKRR